MISGWGQPSEKSNSGAIVQKILREFLKIPPPDPDAPGSFRLAQDGTCKSVLTEAGFKNTEELDLFGKVTFPSAEGYWNFISEMQTPVRNALAEKDETYREEMRTFVMNEAKPFIKNEKVEFMWHAKIGSGMK